MKSKPASTLFATLGVFTGILLCLASATSARAATILINPGSPGSQSSGIFLNITAAFTGAFGSTLAGQSVQLDLRFSDMKYLVPPGIGFRTQLNVDYNDRSFVPATIHDIFLFDQAGNSLVTPSSTRSGTAGGGAVGGLSITGEYSPTTEFFHGVHFDLTLPNTGYSVHSVAIYFQTYNSDVPFTVGVVPEPSVGAMFLMAFLGGAFVRRRK